MRWPPSPGVVTWKPLRISLRTSPRTGTLGQVGSAQWGHPVSQSNKQDNRKHMGENKSEPLQVEDDVTEQNFESLKDSLWKYALPVRSPWWCHMKRWALIIDQFVCADQTWVKYLFEFCKLKIKRKKKIKIQESSVKHSWPKCWIVQNKCMDISENKMDSFKIASNLQGIYWCLMGLKYFTDKAFDPGLVRQGGVWNVPLCVYFLAPILKHTWLKYCTWCALYPSHP